MTRSLFKRKGQSGATLFLFIIICFVLLPAVFLMLQRSIFQNRIALRDRNIKTSREMAESIGTDFMNSFSSDWHRDPFDSLYAQHNNPKYANLGEATSDLTIVRSSGTVRIQTVATYDKGGTLHVRERVTRGVDALYTWVSDSLKFDYVWNTPVTFGAALDQKFDQANFGNLNNSVFVRGDFDSGTSTFPFTLSGFWVVKGTFTLRDPARLNSAIVHCYSFNNVGGADTSLSTIRTIPAKDFFPNFEIIPPEGGGVPGSLAYYDSRNTSDVVVPPGTAQRLELLATDQYVLTPLDSSYVPTGVAPITTSFFTGPVSSTTPFSIVFQGGGSVELFSAVVSRPITVVVIGGSSRVVGDVTYDGSATASAIRSFAFLCEKNINFESATPQHLDGFYGTTLGTLQFLSDQNVTVNGTLSGPVGTYSAPWGTLLTVSADPELGRYPPPLFPRRPRIIMWDYVP